MPDFDRFRKGRRIPVTDENEGPPGTGDGAGGEAAGEFAAEQPIEMPQAHSHSQPHAHSHSHGGDDASAKLREMEDNWKRTAADLENYRKRFDREIVRLRELERETILRSWLDVVDNFERALSVEGAASNPWYEGMEAIHQQMLSVLRQYGAQPFDAMGEKFDPNRHEAIAVANIPDKPEGQIVDVVQTGWELGGRVLRPAKVIPVKRTFMT